jgi:heme/copper-type cytochrome/quinol oxidase subunit 2
MADNRLAFILWGCAAVLLLLFAFSMMGDGTWMGGIAMGWMMAVPLVVLGIAVYFAYKYGRMAERVEQQPKP